MRTTSSQGARSIAPISVAVAVVALSFGAHHLLLPRHEAGDAASPGSAGAPAGAARSSQSTTGAHPRDPGTVGTRTWATRDFPKNQHGLSYGSDAQAASPAQMPDLIAVITQAGTTGFVRKDDLLAAEGDPSLFSSPEQALAWQAAHRTDTSVPAYAVDGTTPAGFIVVHPGHGCEGSNCATGMPSPN